MGKGKTYKKIEDFRVTLWEKHEIPESVIHYDKALRIAVKEAFKERGITFRKLLERYGYGEKVYFHFINWLNGNTRTLYLGVLFDLLEKCGIPYTEVLENSRRIFYNKK